MEFFTKAKTVRLRSHHDKYLTAEDDKEGVTQERSGMSHAATWIVEVVGGSGVIRLKSCYGRYLTASNVPFLLGVTGRKVLQTLPRRLDSSVEWEPVREGVEVKLKTRYGQYLRANAGLPPWRNSITHDIPHSNSHRDWILWEVNVVEARPPSPERNPFPAGSASSTLPSCSSDVGGFDSSALTGRPGSFDSASTAPSSFGSDHHPALSKQKSHKPSSESEEKKSRPARAKTHSSQTKRTTTPISNDNNADERREAGRRTCRKENKKKK